MFDIGLSELMLIGVVALVVIGPERLPKVARTAGILLGRLQRYVSDVKDDIQRELQLEELKKLQEEVAEQARLAESSTRREAGELESSLNNVIAPPDMPSLSPEAPVADLTGATPAPCVPAGTVSEPERPASQSETGAGDTVKP
ncbi:MAG: twin-arginine translocase subunit TatB [Betaproteobacteria bacterium HGW-Betaproteobacteria-11]|nr:MAG: twin-arginine translocase subunit TatB [Betaproteobacteria bacterium HGW-Betaproteobacteria-11]